jgi:hypothetical protein
MIGICDSDQYNRNASMVVIARRIATGDNNTDRKMQKRHCFRSLFKYLDLALVETRGL